MKRLQFRSLIFIATLLASHLRAMDDSEIIPRPLTEKFAYHRCIPTLLSLAITKASYDDIEKYVPKNYQVYDYVKNFKVAPHKTNALEDFKLWVSKKKDFNEIDFNNSFRLDKRFTPVWKHILGHADLTQYMFNHGLCEADRYANLNAINHLVQAGARGEFFNRFHNHLRDNPLHYAIIRHAFLGENLTFKRGNNNSLYYAVMSGDNTIKTGEINEQNVNESSYYNLHTYTPLMVAAAYNLSEVVKELAPYASQENKDESLNRAALYDACMVIEPLIANGANVNARAKREQTLSNEGDAPLYSAAIWANVDAIHLLVNRGADTTTQDTSGETPLHSAVTWCDAAMIDFFVRNHADITAKNNVSETLLHSAAKWGNGAATQALIDRGLGINARDTNGRSPLISSHHYLISQLLIANGADITAQDRNGKTPLHDAVCYGNDIPRAQLFITNGADVNAQDGNNKTPLHHATHNAQIDMMRFLLVNGAQVNTVDRNGFTPLHITAKHGRYDNDEFEPSLRPDTPKDYLGSAQLLIANHADVHAKNGNWGETPLEVAASFGASDVAQLLIANGVNVNEKNFYGDTPLHKAARERNNIRMATFLLANGSDLYAKNNNGQTPFKVARGSAMRDLLKQRALDHLEGKC